MPPSLDDGKRLARERLESTVRALKAQPIDPSTLPFLRAFGLGYAASTAPALIKLILRLVFARKGRSTVGQTIKQIVGVLVKGLSPRGLAVASGISVGGAKWGESRVEPLVRRTLVALESKVRQKRRKQGSLEDGGRDEQGEPSGVSDEVVKGVSTLLSGTISSLIAMTILQSSPEYRRPRFGTPIPAKDPSPYPSLVGGDDDDDTPITSLKPPPVQSPTLDITLFLLVRAVDTLARGVHEQIGSPSGRAGTVVDFLASHSDVLVFQLSCWRIMWCWFYLPERLNPSYSLWITKLARMDSRLLKLLQYARNNEYVYGQVPSKKVAIMSRGIASAMGRDEILVNPQYIKRLDCSFVHGKLGGPGGCEQNAVKRWARAFIDALSIYLPVHFIPYLLFNLRRLAAQPLVVLPKILLAASRSSAFLATFVATIYASVCLVRTRLPGLLPFINQQPLDSGLCTALGCFLCGFSVLIEKKHRRREMALFCAPRALYAVMDEVVPTVFTKGPMGDFLSRWIERLVFAASTGTVLSATVHRPDLVSESCGE